MNLNLIRRSEKTVEKSEITRLSEKLKLHTRLTELLFSRGLNTEELILKFLKADKINFYDPFLFKGMDKAVERINQAIQNEEKIVIYGDYDADGVCAAAIIALYLSGRGLNVYTHIPNRIGEGYGLSVESIEKIIESCCPDLIITCDCGISGHTEVEYAMDLGVDVIVTDHHEVSDVIPSCIVINPKQTDCNYPYNQLCGAGVAFKLVHALGGIDAAAEFLDLAAVATIADLVPLLDENRLIVQLGLKKLEEKKNLGLKLLFDNQAITFPVSSSDIAYKIAPRINAAGRMGDAYRAFELLTLSDPKRVSEILVQINDDNNKRKELCDELYLEAVTDLKYEDLINNRSIILSNPAWEKGITGILAARLAGDFKRPAFVMVNSGGQYKGTSRSIPGINIYELLGSLSDILVEFGGHSQAAGFSIKESDIPSFKSRVNEYLKSFPESFFEPNLEYDLEVPLDELKIDLARALDSVEPTGNGNTKPLFKTIVNTLTVSPCKNNINHSNITAENGFGMLAFNFYAQNQFLLGKSEKELILEVQLNTYGNKESVKGILRGVAPTKLYVNDEVAKGNFLKTMAYASAENFIGKAGERLDKLSENLCGNLGENVDCKLYKENELFDIIGDNIFGTMIIAGCKETYEKFLSLTQKIQTPLINEFLYSTSKNNYSKVIVSPEMDENILLSGYNKIIFLDTPPAMAFANYLKRAVKAEVYVPAESNEDKFFIGVSAERAVLGHYFEVIRANSQIVASNILTYFKLLAAKTDITLSQFVACVLVFAQLNLITISDDVFSIRVNKDVKRDLSESTIYNYLKSKI